jgi:RHS repeat-associated protein
LTSAGSGSSAFGYAGQWNDASGLMDMRARYYQPEDGRFLTEDAWQGDQNQPMSYNVWLYGYANPVRYTDPTGNKIPYPADPLFNLSPLNLDSFLLQHIFGDIPDYDGLKYVTDNKSAFDGMAQYIENNGLHKTTIAAAIAVQSEWRNFRIDFVENLAYEVKRDGCANKVVEFFLNKTGWGELVDDVLYKRNHAAVGFAKVFPYLENKSADPPLILKNGEPVEIYGDLNTMSESIKAMTVRIKAVEDQCDRLNLPCYEKDRLIIAGMAQNTWGRGDEMTIIQNNSIDPKTHTIFWPAYIKTLGLLTDTHPFIKDPITNITSGWDDYRASFIKNYNSTFQLKLFTQDMMALNQAGWDLPPKIDTTVLNKMLNLAVLGHE